MLNRIQSTEGRTRKAPAPAPDALNSVISNLYSVLYPPPPFAFPLFPPILPRMTSRRLLALYFILVLAAMTWVSWQACVNP